MNIPVLAEGSGCWAMVTGGELGALKILSLVLTTWGVAAFMSSSGISSRGGM